jgi:hypothetical protein
VARGQIAKPARGGVITPDLLGHVHGDELGVTAEAVRGVLEADLGLVAGVGDDQPPALGDVVVALGEAGTVPTLTASTTVIGLALALWFTQPSTALNVEPRNVITFGVPDDQYIGLPACAPKRVNAVCEAQSLRTMYSGPEQSAFSNQNWR